MLDTQMVESTVKDRQLEDRIKDLDIALKRIENSMQVSGTESTKVFAEIREKFRLMGQQIAHLNSITFPQYWEQEIRELKDAVYKADCKITEEVTRWKEFRETKYFEAVDEIEAAKWYKMAGVTLKEVADVVEMDQAGLSRLLNGERKKANPMTCYKIKQYCLSKMSKEQ